MNQIGDLTATLKASLEIVANGSDQPKSRRQTDRGRGMDVHVCFALYAFSKMEKLS